MTASKAHLQYVVPEGPTLLKRRGGNARTISLFEQAVSQGRSGYSAFPARLGLGCTPTLAPQPRRNLPPGTVEFKGNSNAGITAGVDQPGNVCEGYGGKGVPSAGLDLVAGRGGQSGAGYARTVDVEGQPVVWDPCRTTDAVGIHLCDRTSPYDNFPQGLPSGGNEKVRGVAAMTTVADTFLQVVRDGGGNFLAGFHNRDAAGEKVISVEGFKFMVDTDQDLSGVVKAKPLVELLQRMYKSSSEASDSFANYRKALEPFLDAILNHNHNSAFNGIPTSMAYNMLYDGYRSKFQVTADVETGVLNGIVNAKQDEMALDALSAAYIGSHGVKVT